MWILISIILYEFLDLLLLFFVYRGKAWDILAIPFDDQVSRIQSKNGLILSMKFWPFLIVLSPWIKKYHTKNWIKNNFKDISI